MALSVPGSPLALLAIAAASMGLPLSLAALLGSMLMGRLLLRPLGLVLDLLLSRLLHVLDAHWGGLGLLLDVPVGQLLHALHLLPSRLLHGLDFH